MNGLSRKFKKSAAEIKKFPAPKLFEFLNAIEERFAGHIELTEQHRKEVDDAHKAIVSSPKANEKVLGGLAKSRFVGPYAQLKLARSKYVSVRINMAENEKLLSLTAMKELKVDEVEEVREAYRDNTIIQVQVARGMDIDARLELVQRDEGKLADEAMDVLAKDKVPDIRATLAGREDITDSAHETLKKDPNPVVQEALDCNVFIEGHGTLDSSYYDYDSF